MRLRAVAAATILGLAGSLLVAGPVSAQRPPRDGHHGPVSVTTDVPPGGTSMLTGPSLGDATKATVTVRPDRGASAVQEEIFDDFLGSIGSLSKGKRLLVCVVMFHYVASGGGLYGEAVKYRAGFINEAFAILGGCLKLAGLIGSGSPPGRAAGRTCDRGDTSIPVKIRKKRAGVQLRIDAKTRAVRKPALKVTCRVVGHKVTYQVRATKKGVPLRKVVGKKLSVGLQSPTDAESSVPVKVTFDTP